jgi:signal peptidase I
MSNTDLFTAVSAELLANGFGVQFEARGTSMFPTIKDGESVTVQPTSSRDIRRGDIILYSGSRGVIAHRVVRIHRSRGEAPIFILRGDSSDSCDEPVGPARVLGKIVSVRRDGKNQRLEGKRARLSYAARRRVSKLKAWSRSAFPLSGSRT